MGGRHRDLGIAGYLGLTRRLVSPIVRPKVVRRCQVAGKTYSFVQPTGTLRGTKVARRTSNWLWGLPSPSEHAFGYGLAPYRGLWAAVLDQLPPYPPGEK